MTSKTKRAQSISPIEGAMLQPMYGDESAPGEVKTEEIEQRDDVVPMENKDQDPESEGMNMGDTKEVIDTDTRPVWEKMQDKIEELIGRVAEYFDDNNDKSERKPPIIKAPSQPIAEEFEQHQATHTPYAAWCKHCAAARAIRRQHPRKGRGAIVVPDVENGIEGLIKVSIDYMYLHERTRQGQESKYNPPYLVMIEHRHGRCWVYQVPNKGVHDRANWLPMKIVQDLDNNGLKDVKIQLKSDQEPSIVNVQTAVQEIRPGMVIPTNSPVGESQCNGRVENTIRRIQEKTRALRHQLEHNPKCKIPDEAPIMSWLVRWAGELLSKYSPGDDGRTPYERIRQETCVVPIAPLEKT